MRIKSIEVKEVPDSRGEPTIEVEVFSGARRAATAIPSGKSRGRREAVALAPGAARASAAALMEQGIGEEDFPTIRVLDGWLCAYDPSPAKEAVGGNVALGISLSFAKIFAAEQGRELWEVIRDEFFSGGAAAPAHRYPTIFSNLINGGAHARNGLDIQEYMVIVPPREPFSAGVAELKDFYASLGAELRVSSPRKRGSRYESVPLGDEGGYAPRFASAEDPLRVLAAHLARTGFDARLALDAAASAFKEKGGYVFEGAHRSAEDMVAIYKKYTEEFPALYSIEDPFAEDDRGGFKALRAALPDLLVVGDDCTVTRADLIDRAAAEGLIHGVIIKPNQVGTLTETCEAIAAARRHGIKEIISHRSGETSDVSIIHIAKACGAYGVKIGAPARERLLKFDELERLYR